MFDLPVLPLDSIKVDYRNNQPFPHLVFDDFFNPEALSLVLKEFPDLSSSSKSSQLNNSRQQKFSLSEYSLFGQNTQLLIKTLNSPVFLKFLSGLTGIEEILADDSLLGGGLHEIMRNGHLKIHSDFTEHRTLKWYRRINVIVFLNKDWKEEWGGELQLWDNKMTECQVKIAPVFNRVVVFSTLKDSFHGHPDPLLCPGSVSRKSIALYYYTRTIPQDPRLTTERQKTTFKVRPDEKADLVAIKGAWYKRWWNAIKP